jgi:hypothetical protein
LKNATEMREQVTNNQTRQKEKLDALRKDLASVKKDADAAQGTVMSFQRRVFSVLITVLQRLKGRRRNTTYLLVMRVFKNIVNCKFL